jgi:uncharacterized membrane protein YgcG
MRKVHGKSILLASLALFLFPAMAHARGCLAAGTMISTPDGPVAVEKLRVGDAVWSIDAAGIHRAKVAGTFAVWAPEMLRIRAGNIELRVTPEHPLQVSPGTFTEAGFLHPNNTLWIWEDHALHRVTIDSIEREAMPQAAYNLLVFPGGTYLANGAAVHNKGCFLPDTPILKADGSETPISSIRVGDRLAAFAPVGETGQLVSTTVESIVVLQVDRYCRVTTDSAILDVTEEHPFFVGNGTFKILSSLSPGDTVFAAVGDRLVSQHILSIEHIDRPATVYNLQTDDPHTFFANGIAVHNKGGHGGGHGGFGGGGFSSGWGGHSYHSSYGGYAYNNSASGEWIFLVVIIIFVLFIFRANAQSNRARDSAVDLDYVHSPRNVAPKTEHTERLLNHLSRMDPSVDPDWLKGIAKSTFLQLQECWQARQFDAMEPLLMPALYHSHVAQLNAMIQQHEIDHIDNLCVDRIDLVNVRFTQRADQREFTALIAATARDYYTDDRTGAVLRGDDIPTRFQEFWIFHFMNGNWLLREIEQSRESDALRDQNVVETMSDAQVEQIAGPAPKAIHAPWADPDSSARASRLEARLQELAAADPIWDRTVLLSRARDTFLVVPKNPATSPRWIPPI